MKAQKTTGAKSAKPSRRETLSEFATRSKAPDDKPWPIVERLLKWTDLEHVALKHRASLQFEAQTRLDSTEAIETLFFSQSEQCWYLARATRRSDPEFLFEEQWRRLDAKQALLWSIDRLLGPATFAAAKQFIQTMKSNRKEPTNC